MYTNSQLLWLIYSSLLMLMGPTMASVIYLALKARRTKREMDATFNRVYRPSPSSEESIEEKKKAA